MLWLYTALLVLLQSLSVGHLVLLLTCHMDLSELLLVVRQTLADVNLRHHLVVPLALPQPLELELILRVRVPLRVIAVNIRL